MSKMQPAQNRVDPYGPAEPFCDDSTSVGVPKFKSQPVSARSAARAILVMLSAPVLTRWRILSSSKQARETHQAKSLSF